MKKAFTILCCALTMIGVVGCSSASGPKKAVNGFTESLKSGDIEKASAYVETTEDFNLDDIKESFDGVEPKDVYSMLFKKLEVTVEKEDVKDDKATLEVKVKNVNLMTAIFSIAFSGIDTEDTSAALEAMKTTIDGATAVEIKSTVNLVKKDDKWVLSSDNEDFMAAMMGMDKNALEKQFNSGNTDSTDNTDTNTENK